MKRTVLLLSGEINSGKNYAFSLIKRMLDDLNIEVKHVFFAQHLKNICAYTFSRYSEHLDNRLSEISKLVNDPNALKLIDSLRFSSENWYEDKTESTRILLQDVGTRLIREHVDEEFWPKRVVEEIEQSSAPVIIATDFRFPNEHDVLRKYLSEEYSIITLRINRDAGTGEFIKNHPSESSLSNFKFSSIIENRETLEEFEKSIRDWSEEFIKKL